MKNILINVRCQLLRYSICGGWNLRGIVQISPGKNQISADRDKLIIQLLLILQISKLYEIKHKTQNIFLTPANSDKKRGSQLNDPLFYVYISSEIGLKNHK